MHGFALPGPVPELSRCGSRHSCRRSNMTEYGGTVTHERSIDRRDDQVKGFIKDGIVIDVISDDVGLNEGK